MRQVRSLPPLLRVAFSVGLLFFLAGIAFFVTFITSFVTRQSSAPHAPLEDVRKFLIAMYLLLLCPACTLVCAAYRTRAGRPALGPSPLDSWQGQVRALLLLSALPLGGLALALVMPPTAVVSLIVEGLILFLAPLNSLVSWIRLRA